MSPPILSNPDLLLNGQIVLRHEQNFTCIGSSSSGNGACYERLLIRNFKRPGVATYALRCGSAPTSPTCSKCPAERRRARGELSAARDSESQGGACGYTGLDKIERMTHLGFRSGAADADD